MIAKHSTSFLVLPAHCNYEPLIFGGHLMGEMDKCAAMCANRLLYSSPTCVDAITVAVDEVSFPAGPQVKDIVFLEAEAIAVGIKSITIKVSGELERAGTGKRLPTCNGIFTFVSRNGNGEIVPHKLQESFRVYEIYRN